MTVTRPLSNSDYRTLARFRYALRTFMRFSEDAARAAGLTPSQHQLLLAIRGFPGSDPPAMADVAELLQLRLHSAGELVDRAVANGLVVRIADDADHRRVLLTLTTEGEAKLAQLSVLHREELRRFRAEMNEVLQELERFEN
ncbi:MAG: MarR family transcriptional regulator [Acidimicrobiia bacterium]|nr:MarR family transcriptional regulator [Acidimicrobiia bacterium]